MCIVGTDRQCKSHTHLLDPTYLTIFSYPPINTCVFVMTFNLLKVKAKKLSSCESDRDRLLVQLVCQ